MRAFTDGYERTVGIREQVGLAPPVEWKYRPLAGPEGAVAYLAQLRSEDPIKTKAEFVHSRIIAWRFPDSEDASPEFTKPTLEQVLDINAVCYNRIEQCLLGTTAADYELKLTGEIVEPALTDGEQAALDAKNSPAGSAS